MSNELDSGMQEMRAGLRRMEARLAEMERRLVDLERPHVHAAGAGEAGKAGGMLKDLQDSHMPVSRPQAVPLATAVPQPVARKEELYEIAPAPVPLPVRHAPVPAKTSSPPAPPLLAVPPQTPPRPIPPSAIHGSAPAGAARGAEGPVAGPSRMATFAARNMTVAPPPVAPPRGVQSLESKIGKSWAAWIGGLLVLGAILYFVKLAWDNGWLHPSPGTRIAMAMTGGAAIVGLGQWAYRKKMGPLAASLTATGLAVLMATFFGANTLFEHPVLSRTAAFTGVLVVGAGGIALALQMRMMSLAILALLGMYISPAILRGTDDQSLAFLVYLAVVTATGLGVSFFKRKWLAVRGVAFAAGWIWLLVWVGLLQSPQHPQLAIAFCSFFFILFLAELTGSLVRVTSPPADELPANAPDLRPASPNTLVLESAASLLAFANTTIAMTAFAIAVNRTGMGHLWIIALGLAGVMAIVSFITAYKYFSLSTGIQAMALVVLAVPLYFEHSAITFAWALLGLALAGYTYFSNSKVARAWMVVMLSLVALRICTFDLLDSATRRVIFHLGDQEVTSWMLMGWGTALYGLLVAWLGRVRASILPDGKIARQGRRWVVVVATVLATFLWCLATLRGFNAGMPVMVMLIAWAAALLFLGPLVLGEAPATTMEAAATIVALVIAVPFYFEHSCALYAWAFLGMAPALYAYFTNNKIAWVWTLGMTVLVAARVLISGLFDETLQVTLRTVGGVKLTEFMLTGWGAALYALLLAWSSRERPERTADGGLEPYGVRSMMSAHVALGSLIWCVVSGVGVDSASPLTLLVMLWALAVIGFGFVTVIEPLANWVETPAVVLLFAAFAKWLAFDGLMRSVFDPDGDGQTMIPLLNLFVLNGLLMVAAIVLARMLRQAGKPALAWWIAGIGFVILNIESLRATDRWLAEISRNIGGTQVTPWLAKNVVISILWGLIALAAIPVGFAKKIAQIRWAALALLGLTVLKVLVIDMANVETILRVLSFMVVGAVLLLVSFVYHKATRKQQQESAVP